MGEGGGKAIRPQCPRDDKHYENGLPQNANGEMANTDYHLTARLNHLEIGKQSVINFTQS